MWWQALGRGPARRHSRLPSRSTTVQRSAWPCAGGARRILELANAIPRGLHRTRMTRCSPSSDSCNVVPLSIVVRPYESRIRMLCVKRAAVDRHITSWSRSKDRRSPLS
jgi:hypothetical protein